jgi:hypothetical protein
VTDPRVGDYVKVIETPDSWEGSGEDEEDRVALIGHVGVIVELDHGDYTDKHGKPTGMALVRFPVGRLDGDDWKQRSVQRNIEFTALSQVSSPLNPLPQSLLDNG